MFRLGLPLCAEVYRNRAGLRGDSDTNRSVLVAYVDANRTYLSSIAELFRFLSTPEGRPTLNSQGLMDFQTQTAVSRFRDIAERVDISSAAVVRAVEQLEAHRQSNLNQMQQRLSR